MEELNLKDLLTVIKRKKISIIVIIVISIIAGIIYTYNCTKPLYNSTATIILGKVSSSVTGQNLDNSGTITESDLTLNSSLILTYSELVKSRTIMKQVKANLGTDISIETLMTSVSVDRVNNSDLLAISVSNPSGQMAKDIVTKVVEVFSEQVKEIYKIDNVYVIDEPTVPTEPYNIDHNKDIIIFTCLGFIVACIYVFIYNLLDNTVKTGEDIEELLKVKNLITIPFDKKKKSEIITFTENKAIISESFRTLRTNVQFSSINTKGAQTLLVTSCLAGEGKSYVSANLAITFAQAGKKVILVDSDMRRGRQALVFNIPNKNGLSNYISNIDSNGIEINWNLDKYIKRTNIENLDVITAGSIPPNPAELLESTKFVELIDNLKQYYDVVIFDGAPILPITDSLLVSRLLVKTLLVASYNKTKKDSLIKAKTDIENVGGKVIGTVLNGVSMENDIYISNYYYSNETKLSWYEKCIKFEKEKIDMVKQWFKNLVRKLKTFNKRLSSAKTSEQIKIEEQAKIEKIQKKQQEKEEKAKQAKIMAEEKAKEDAIMAEEKAKREAELAKKREEDKLKKEQELALKMEMKKKKEEENAVKRKENLEKKAQRKEEWNKKVDIFKEKALVKKNELAENMKIKKEEFSKKYQEYKVTKAEENKAKSEAKAIRNAELAKIREEERIKKDEEKLKRAEEKRLANEEKAKQAAIIAEERAKKAAIMAEEKAKKEAELAKIREEERIRKEEEKAKKEAEAKFTDEYLEENLYPKTKYSKF